MWRLLWHSISEGKVNALCTHHGVQFSAGEQWQEDNCTICQCKDGEVSCQSTVCPVLHCTVRVKQPTECCPVCLSKSPGSNPFVYRLSISKNVPRIKIKTSNVTFNCCTEGPVFIISNKVRRIVEPKTHMGISQFWVHLFWNALECFKDIFKSPVMIEVILGFLQHPF